MERIPEEQEKMRQQIERDTAAFLAAGGKIKVIPIMRKTVETVMAPSEVQELRAALARARKEPNVFEPPAHRVAAYGDLTGKRFGLLTVTGNIRPSYWSLVCDCGAEDKAETAFLVAGKKKMCRKCLVKVRKGDL